MSNYDIVFHVDKADASLQVAFNNAVNYRNALQGEEFNMVLVANSKAVTLLVRSNTEIQPKMQAALAKGLKVCVCQNALDETKTNTQELFEACNVVPAGVVEIVNLQRAGYAYIKP